MRHINRKVPIVDVARALGLRLDGAGKIHCWHPDRHKNGDRTASVGIRRTNNTVKCFACDSKPIGPIDLVMDVNGIGAGDAALWIAGRFEVPWIPAGKHLTTPDRRRDPVGYETGLELLVRSGLFGNMSEAARCIAPVLLEMSERDGPLDQEFSLQMSYVAISRYAGVSSPTAVRRALVELEEIGFLILPESGLRPSPNRRAATYIVKPNSGPLTELANTFSEQMRTEIAAEREIRSRSRKERIQALANAKGFDSAGREKGTQTPPPSPTPSSFASEQNSTPSERDGTKYKPLYPTDSDARNNAIPRIAPNSTNRLPPASGRKGIG